MQTMTQIAFLEPPNRTIGRCTGKNSRIAQVFKMSDRALLKQPSVQPCGTRGLQKITWRDEDHLAACGEMTHGFFDEMQIQIRMPIQ